MNERMAKMARSQRSGGINGMAWRSSGSVAKWHGAIMKAKSAKSNERKRNENNENNQAAGVMAAKWHGGSHRSIMAKAK